MQKAFVLAVVCWLFLGLSPVQADRFAPNWGYAGRLEAITNDYIIVNDQRYDVAPGMRFFSISGKFVSKIDFEEGSAVALALNLDKREVYALWLVDQEVP